MTKARVEIACQFVATYEDGQVTGWTVTPWASYAGYMGKAAEVLSGDEGLDVETMDGPFWRAVQHHLSVTGETRGGALAVEWEEDGPSEIPATGEAGHASRAMEDGDR